MDSKKYSSYADIDRDLEILKIEREIHYQKIILSIDTTKENLKPLRVIGSIFRGYKKIFKSNYGKIIELGLTYFLARYINKKRGQ